MKRLKIRIFLENRKNEHSEYAIAYKVCNYLRYLSKNVIKIIYYKKIYEFIAKLL